GNPENSNYGSHAVWVSGDSKYAITADEKSGGFINIFDIQDFDNINLLATWYPNKPQAASKSVHNVFWKDDLLYISYYVYGTRVVDMSDPSNPVEVGYYDFYPGDAGLYNGNWGTYPYTANGLIYSTGFSGNGFFVMSYPFYGDIEFDELKDTEDNVSSIPLGVTIAQSLNYTIDYSTLMLFWGLNGTLTDSVFMNADGGLYTADIVPNGDDGTMHYYVAFETTDGNRVTKPYGAPFSTFTFNIGADQIAPVVHSLSDIDDQLYPNGSHIVYADVTDNIGVDSVYLFWQVGDGIEQSVPCTHIYNSSIYEGELTYSDLPPGTDINYWIQVIDASSLANQTESEMKLFYVTDDYILGNFENELALSDWNLGTWGRQYVNSEIGFAINDSPGTTYEPNAENPCDLIEPINLTYFDHAYFRFISGEMLGDGDFGYLQLKQGTDGLWSTKLTVNSFNVIKQKYVDLDEYLNEDELYIRLLFTSDSDNESTGWFVDDIHLVLNQEMPIVGVEDDLNLPSDIVLHNAYPNPFNPMTTIQYKLPNAGIVDLKIYDLMGREVRSLVNAFTSAGTQSVIWDAKDDNGNSVSSGVYIYRLESQGQLHSKKLVLLK
ncbi:MAG: T9SS type A sorting domain-containing protein, partial [Candidatus Marinimicrobia bacterium]|nr:T9SS type A sorting domain-containing protein [Candidatus Neomarinimicrobiota bacterium]